MILLAIKKKKKNWKFQTENAGKGLLFLPFFYRLYVSFLKSQIHSTTQWTLKTEPWPDLYNLYNTKRDH